MKAKTHVVAGLTLAAAAFALLVPVAQAGPGARGIDAHERSSAAKLVATTTMEDAHQRMGVVSEPRTLVGIDAHERLGRQVGTPAPTGSSIADNAFDWGAAAIGASSALVLALLIGASLITARRYRGGPVPR
jgi:hypothetical protein